MQYKWVALTVTMVGTLMAGVDDRILVVGLPTITKEIGANIGEAIWAGQAYTLASLLSLLIAGRFADMHGRVKLYNVGFVIFTVGSALASISLNPIELIASRFVQGTGAAMLSANSLAIVTDATPPGELGTSIGFNQIGFRGGAIAGLTLSGFILSFADWRALFYINIPIGIFGTIWAHRRLKEISTRDVARKMDWLGFITLTSGLILVFLAITTLGYGGSWVVTGSALLSVGCATILLFISLERRSTSPLLDLRLFRIRAFAAGSSILLISQLTWNAILYLTSFYVQVALGYSPLQAGLSYVPLEVTFLLVGSSASRLSDRYGARGFATAGLAVIASACFYASTFTTSTTYPLVLTLLVLLALGQGLFSGPNRRSIMASVPANRRGVSSGFSSTLNQIGSTAGPLVATTLVTLGIPSNLFSSLIQSGSPVGALIERQEFVNGYRTVTLILGILTLVALVPSYLRGSASSPSPSRPSGEVDDESSVPDSAAEMNPGVTNLSLAPTVVGGTAAQRTLNSSNASYGR